MIKLRKLYYLAFFLIILSCFLIGGFLQLFVGIPNTVFSYGVVSLLFIFYIIYISLKKKIFFDKVVRTHIILCVIIIISSILNDVNILKVCIYFIFILIPLGSYLFFKVNQKESYISQKTIGKLYLIIACVQLPLIIIQILGYDFFVQFNRSSQSIASYDFMFGSFFLKADHALGFFLLFNIINLIENNKYLRLTNYPKLIIAYLSFTIFISESNISKLVLVFVLGYFVYFSLPKKIRIISFFLAIIFVVIAFNILKNLDTFEREIYFIENEYNVEKSNKNFERGIAKRPQVIISYMTKVPLKIIGDGPYSYFNILTGKFTNTEHFSQIIWTYADLGILGIILFITLLYAIINSLGLNKSLTMVIFIIVLIYGLMTTIFSDLAIIITLLSLLQNTRTRKLVSGDLNFSQ